MTRGHQEVWEGGRKCARTNKRQTRVIPATCTHCSSESIRKLRRGSSCVCKKFAGPAIDKQAKNVGRSKYKCLLRNSSYTQKCVRIFVEGPSFISPLSTSPPIGAAGNNSNNRPFPAFLIRRSVRPSVRPSHACLARPGNESVRPSASLRNRSQPCQPVAGSFASVPCLPARFRCLHAFDGQQRSGRISSFSRREAACQLSSS